MHTKKNIHDILLYVVIFVFVSCFSIFLLPTVHFLNITPVTKLITKDYYATLLCRLHH
jgi:hypothetical protein